MNLIIPAAGMGNRFRSVGVNTPKPLIPILGIPMIGWVIANFDLESEDSIIIVSRKEDLIPEHLKKFNFKVFEKLKFIEIDNITDGPASTLELALNQIDNRNPILCVNSDQYVSADLSDFLREVRNGKSDGQILTMGAMGEKWSYVGRDSKGNVERIVEKVEISDEATVGIYAWRTQEIVARAILKMKSEGDKVNNEYYVAPAFNYMIRDSLQVYTNNIGFEGIDVHGLGTPEDLDKFMRNINQKDFFMKVSKTLNEK